MNEVEILLVEDNASDAELALRALKKNHISNQIEVVEDGEEALNFLFSRGKYEGRDVLPGPRLILLDIKLPLISGLEVLRIIKADERTKKIPVVVLTSSAEEKDIYESYQLGVNSYIVKPVNFEKFTATVTSLGMYWLLVNMPPV